jgi:hypothetical protein
MLHTNWNPYTRQITYVSRSLRTVRLTHGQEDVTENWQLTTLHRHWTSRCQIHSHQKYQAWFLVKRLWPFSRDIFTDEDISLSAVTDRSLQDTKNLEKFFTVVFWQFKFEYMFQLSAFNIRLNHRSIVFRKKSAPCKPCWNGTLSKAETLREKSRQKPRVGAVLLTLQ